MADNQRTATWGWTALAIVVVAAVLVWGASTNWWGAEDDFQQTADTGFQTTDFSTGVPIEQVNIQNEINNMQEGDELVIENDNGQLMVERSWI